MTVYFRTQGKEGLIEKGKILRLMASKQKVYIVTGEREDAVIELASFKEEVEGQKVFNEIIQRIVEPRAKEIERGVVYIDLSEI